MMSTQHTVYTETDVSNAFTVLFHLRAPASRDHLTASRYAQYQEPQTKAV